MRVELLHRQGASGGMGDAVAPRQLPQWQWLNVFYAHSSRAQIWAAPHRRSLAFAPVVTHTCQSFVNRLLYR